MREVSKDYGIEFRGNKNIPLHQYLKERGNVPLGNLLEFLEKEARA